MANCFFSAAKIALPLRGAAGVVVAQYGELSGTDNTYGFFGPSVAPDVKLCGLLVQEDHLQGISLQQEQNAEIGVRLGTMAVSLLKYEPELRRAVSACYARYLFQRYPDAQRLTVVAEAFQVPTMLEYRSGNNAAWKRMFQIDIANNASNKGSQDASGQ